MSGLLLVVAAFFAQALLVVGESKSSSPWMEPPQTPSAIGDYTEAERELIRSVDPGIEGSPTAVGSADTGFGSRLTADGGKDLNSKALGPDEWGPMHNLKVLSKPYDYYGTTIVDTDEGKQPAEQYVYTAGYTLEERPRRMALLIMDIQIDYIPFIGYLIPEAKKVLEAFRSRGLPVFWSNWLRRSNDGLYGALDRFYGPRGVQSGDNPMYVYEKDGSATVPELEPTPEELAFGHIKSMHLSKFADLDENGKSILGQKVKALGIDTLVIVGAWTEDCVISTVSDATDKLNIDAVLVKGAVGTATPDHFPGMELMESGYVKIVTPDEMVGYIKGSKHSEIWKHMSKTSERETNLRKAGVELISSLGERPSPVKTEALQLTLSVFVAALAAACAVGAILGAGIMSKMRSPQHQVSKVKEPLL